MGVKKKHNYMIISQCPLVCSFSSMNCSNFGSRSEAICFWSANKEKLYESSSNFRQIYHRSSMLSLFTVNLSEVSSKISLIYSKSQNSNLF